jgi:hypothetical protein
MPIYEYKGVHYDIDTTDPVVAKQKILANLPPEKSTVDKFLEPLKNMSIQDWSQNSMLAPALKTMSAVTPFGMLQPRVGAQNLQQGSKQLVNKGMEMGQSLANMVMNPAETAQNAYNAITERPAETAGNLVKAAIYDPETMIGAPAAAKSLYNTGKAAAMAPINTVIGAGRGMAYPKGTSPNTALLPIRPTYVPHEQVSEFMAGQRPASSLTEVPTAPLYENNPVANWAYGMAPENEAGLKLVPAKGKFFEGLGENIGSGWRTNPIQALGDIAGLYSGIGPAYSAAKAVPAAASALLTKATQFEPKFGPARAAAMAQEAAGPVAPPVTPAPPAPAGPPPLQLGYTPAQPPAPPPIYVSPEGVASTNMRAADQAGINSKYPPMPTGPGPVSPAELSQQVAASKIPESGPQAVTPAPVVETPPAPVVETPPAPVVEIPPAPVVETPPAPKVDIDTLKARLDQNENQVAQLREPMLGRNPAEMAPAEVEAYRKQMDQLGREHVDLQKQIIELEKLAKKESRATARAEKKRQPSNVSQMLTEDTVFNTKQEWEKANLFNTLAGKKPVGGYKEGEGIVRHERPDYSSIPDSLRKELPDISIVKRNAKGKRITE